MTSPEGTRVALPALRVLGGGILILVLCLLLVRTVGLALGTDDAQSWEVEASSETLLSEDGPGDAQIKVRGVERQTIHIEVDGEEFFSGRLGAGETVETDPGTEVAVDLPDLTRAVVIYNGSRVEPLGKLTAGRRLVFVDDVRE
ncbi:MAG: hypothetical protein VX519_06700 [Myxococcota bacterium]|nr:hypothetical protein [Myxococcota bacterium]